jgi:general L-amino acid transport system permease protein
MKWLQDARVRGWAIQAFALGAFAAVAFWLAHNFLSAPNRPPFSFAFLDNTAGFPIAFTLIEYRLAAQGDPSTYLDALGVGLLNTLFVSVVGIVLATLLGFAIGVARLSRNWLIAKLATIYVEFVRNVPLLLQMFLVAEIFRQSLPLLKNSWDLGGVMLFSNRGVAVPGMQLAPGAWAVGVALIAGMAAAYAVHRYAVRRQLQTGRRMPDGPIGLTLIIGAPALAYLAAGLPIAFDLPTLPNPQCADMRGRGFNYCGGVLLPSAFFAVLLALVLYTASYIAEIVRSGIEGVPKGQNEAAASLGLSAAQRLRLVVIPQAMRIVVPPLTSQYLNLTKNSSLAYALAYPDLFGVFARTGLNQAGRAVEIILIIAGIYLTISLLTSLAMNVYNARIQLKER